MLKKAKKVVTCVTAAIKIILMQVFCCVLYMPLNKNNVELVFKSESAGPLHASVTYKMIHFKDSGPAEENLVHQSYSNPNGVSKIY